jgi:O-methyltransferase domain/Dimerisation domain
MDARQDAVASETAPPGPEHTAQMLQMITGYWVSQMVGAVAELRIADHLGDDALPAEALAHRAGADPAAMMRLLKACVFTGLVSATKDGRFGATPLIRTLAEGPNSWRPLAMALTAPGHWQPWGQFTEAVRSGRPQIIPTLGADIIRYYNQHPAEQALLSQAMTSFTMIIAQEAVRLIDMTGVSTVADIGGSAGALLFALLQVHPKVEGILFDQPAVTAEAVETAQRYGLTDRVQIIGGDFFSSVPKADLLLMKHILHDWNDEECVRILTCCATAMGSGSRLVVIEQPMGEVDQPGSASLIDLNMLAVATGRERTIAEYQSLFEAAGLKPGRVIETRSPYAFLEAVI